jgi:TonB family protein
VQPEPSKFEPPRPYVGSRRGRSTDYTAAEMPLPQKPVRQSSRLATAIIVSLIGHALLLPFVAKDAMFHAPRKQTVGLITGQQFRDLQNSTRSSNSSGPIVSSGQQIARTQPKPPEPKPPEEKSKLIPGQLVSLGTPEDQRAPEKATKYLSEHDSRVEKETRARETSAFFKNALSKAQKEGRNEKSPQGAPAMSEKPGDNGQGGGQEERRRQQLAELPARQQRDPLHVKEAADGTLRDRESTQAMRGTGRRLALADPGSNAQPSAVGPGIPGAAPGSPGSLKPLKLTLDQPLGASGQITGGPMPDDLRGVEEGEGTFLNARGFKFASYLNRVKETVGRVWTQKVTDETTRRDPSGQLYSFKDRRTVIEFTLDKDGDVTDVKVSASSGVQYLDDVAVDAFKLVQRFPNPPPGLLQEDGTVKLPFAFTLLAATGGTKFQVGPAYLPNSPAARGF